MSNETTSSALPGVKATLPEALELNELSVIGLMDARDGMAALIRSARGEIARVTIGDEAFGVQIIAIGDDQVLLTDRWGQTKSLALPRS